MDDPALANTFGTLGAVCWSVQLIPQIIINYRRHNATGLQPTMMMLWAWAGVPLGVYNIVQNFNLPLQIQPQILTVLSLITWIQCYYYEKRWAISRCVVVVLPIACIMGGIEVALIYALRTGVQRGTNWPVTLMAVMAASFLVLGVLRHYWDVYVHRTVRGISFLFVGIDALGDLFSIISVVFEQELDVLGLVIYGTELVLWIGIFACGGYYLLLPWVIKMFKRRKSTIRSTSLAIEAVPRENIALHDLPSSTSVFRTPSSDLELRARTNIPRDVQ